MKSCFKIGETIETLTPDELSGALDSHTANWFQELARGVMTVRFPELTQTAAGGIVSFPATGDERIGPRPGMLWAVQRISAFGLATGDVLSVYRSVANPMNFIGQLTAANPVFHLGGKGFLLRGEETVAVAGTGLMAAGVVTLTGEAIEVGELDAYKLIA